MFENKRNSIWTLVICVLIAFTFMNALVAFAQLVGWPSSSSESVLPEWYLASFGIVNTVLTISLLAVLGKKRWGVYGIVLALLAQVTIYTIFAEKSPIYWLVGAIAIVITSLLF
ncbi:MAG: hypothetical protein HC804_02305 [Anaerolineae bacterium]|nr:hypothetical protein [Anaerolineae bacterium]